MVVANNIFFSTKKARHILIEDPDFIFPLSLQQVTLYRNMQNTSALHSALAKKKMNVSFLFLNKFFF